MTYPDIVNYFLFSLSPLTKEELKAYKSLDSYNQFVSGWVKEVKTKLFGETTLVIGRVNTIPYARQGVNIVPAFAIFKFKV